MSLLVAPVFDDVTQYSVVWAEEAETLLKPEAVLKRRAIKRSEVESSWKDKTLLLFYNHGNESELMGSGSEAVVDNNNIVQAPKEIYTMACLSGKSLGTTAYKNGKVFWGYTDYFSFTTDALEEFQKFANEGIKQRHSGAAWAKALEEGKKLGTELTSQLTDQGKYIAASCMNNNTQALVCYNGHAPQTSTCLFRRLALRLFGDEGWHLRQMLIKGLRK